MAHRYGLRPEKVKSESKENFVSRLPLWALRVLGACFLGASLMLFWEFVKG